MTTPFTEYAAAYGWAATIKQTVGTVLVLIGGAGLCLAAAIMGV
jgi:hypothetical protein